MSVLLSEPKLEFKRRAQSAWASTRDLRVLHGTDGPMDAGPERTWSNAGKVRRMAGSAEAINPVEAAPLPDTSGIRARWWLDAFGPLILLGDGQSAWALRPEGTSMRIPGVVVHGAVLERLADGGGRPITPSGSGRQME